MTLSPPWRYYWAMGKRPLPPSSSQAGDFGPLPPCPVCGCIGVLKWVAGRGTWLAYCTDTIHCDMGVTHKSAEVVREYWHKRKKTPASPKADGVVHPI